MIHIFSDTDIILDLITGRIPFSEEASILFSLIEKHKIISHTSSLTFSNVYYVLRKYASHQKVISRLKELADLLEILTVDERIINKALQSDFKDFEDAIQYCTAQSNPQIRVFITRNIKDYRKAELPVMTPGTFLKTYAHGLKEGS